MMTFEQRRGLVAACTTTEYSDFYRRLYGLSAEQKTLLLSSPEEWTALPFVTKDLLLDTPPQQRLFCDPREVRSVRTSSGTTGRPPLFTPFARSADFTYRADFRHAGDPILAFSLLVPFDNERWLASQGFQPRVVVLDPKNIESSVRLARTVGVRSIFVFTFLMPEIGACMQSLGMTERISYIELAGEPCSSGLYKYLRETFPNAGITGTLGMNEIDNMPFAPSCHLAGNSDEVDLHHARDGSHIELVDPETGESIPVRAGAEGEMVITVGGDGTYASPMIRYRTGDIVRVIGEQCPVHNTWSFKDVGRYEADFVKVRGGVLRADEMERVLRTLGLSDIFELHRYERNTPQGPRTAVDLHLTVPPGTDLQGLSNKIAGLLRVAPTYTYADGVREGHYLPLVCIRLDASPQKQVKRHRVIAH